MKLKLKERRGLTLVEVIVVLLIIEVALLISVQTYVQGLHLQRDTANRSRAALVAQTIMDALLRDAASLRVPLAREGTFPQETQPVDAAKFGLEPSAVEGLQWQASVARHGESRTMSEVTLRLVWTAGGRQKQLELVSLAAAQS